MNSMLIFVFLLCAYNRGITVIIFFNWKILLLAAEERIGLLLEIILFIFVLISLSNAEMRKYKI